MYIYRVANDERMQSNDECRSRGKRRIGGVETNGRAGPDEQSSEKCIAETRPETRAERKKDETLSAGRYNSRASSETKAELRQRRESSRNRRKARAKTQGMTEESSSSCSALSYIESATAVVVLLAESDLQKHANVRRKRRTPSASSAAYSSSSRELLHMTRAFDNKAYIF